MRPVQEMLVSDATRDISGQEAKAIRTLFWVGFRLLVWVRISGCESHNLTKYGCAHVHAFMVPVSAKYPKL